MARELFVTEAVTGRKLHILRSEISEILPCPALAFEYGLFPAPRGPGLPKEAPTWSILEPSNHDMSQISWKDGGPKTFVLHRLGELGSGYSKLHMNPLLLKRYDEQLIFIERMQKNEPSAPVAHIPRFFGLDLALPFEDPNFTTFEALTSHIRDGLRHDIPLGSFEHVPRPLAPATDAAPAAKATIEAGPPKLTEYQIEVIAVNAEVDRILADMAIPRTQAEIDQAAVDFQILQAEWAASPVAPEPMTSREQHVMSVLQQRLKLGNKP